MLVKGVGDEMGTVESGLVGYLVPYMKCILRTKLKSRFKCQLKTSGAPVTEDKEEQFAHRRTVQMRNWVSSDISILGDNFVEKVLLR